MMPLRRGANLSTRRRSLLTPGGRRSSRFARPELLLVELSRCGGCTSTDVEAQRRIVSLMTGSRLAHGPRSSAHGDGDCYALSSLTIRSALASVSSSSAAFRASNRLRQIAIAPRSPAGRDREAATPVDNGQPVRPKPGRRARRNVAYCWNTASARVRAYETRWSLLARLGRPAAGVGTAATVLRARDACGKSPGSPVSRREKACSPSLSDGGYCALE